MELARLMAALADSAAYPYPIGDESVEMRQTHISIVFMAGPFVYKIKKPVNLGFLDYSTLTRRRHFCEEEVRLNRRLAPSVYLGVVPITRDPEGIRIEGSGETIEWAVKMERLPHEATLSERLLRDELGTAPLEALAGRLAAFHARAERGPAVAQYGRFDAVAGNARENLEQSVSLVGTTLSEAVFDRLWTSTDATLADLRTTIESRAARNIPCDGHGDLRLDHIYLFPDRPRPDDLVIIDCIEFNERFRYADPVADIAFVVMDLSRHGRRDLARTFADAYFQAGGDVEGAVLLPFYAAYRAAVRGKVEGIASLEAEVPEADRFAAADRARAHWLLALSEFEQPARRPGLVLVGGLPGTGKSTLSRQLAERAGFTVVRSDVVRKELAGLNPGHSARAEFEQGVYSPAWSERTYAECLRQAEHLLFQGQRVLIDASFRDEATRHRFLDLGRRWGVPTVLLLCKADPAIIQQRVEGRRDDASDADWSIYRQAAERWEPLPEPTARLSRAIATDCPEQPAIDQALAALREVHLLA